MHKSAVLDTVYSCVNMPLVSPALPRDAMIDSEQRQNSQVSCLSTLTAALGCYMRKSSIVLTLTLLLWQVGASDIDYTV